MKDQIGLLAASIVCTLLASVFWRFLGADALNIIASVVIVTLGIDNRRLRKQIAADHARSDT